MAQIHFFVTKWKSPQNISLRSPTMEPSNPSLGVNWFNIEIGAFFLPVFVRFGIVRKLHFHAGLSFFPVFQGPPSEK